MPYAIKNGTKSMLLVNRGKKPMHVQLAGVTGGAAMVVEVNAESVEPGFEPPISKVIGPSGKIQLTMTTA